MVGPIHGFSGWAQRQMVEGMATSVSGKIPGSLYEKYCKAGQEHLFRWVDELTESQVEAFVRQLESFDVDKLLRGFEAAKVTLREARSTLKPSPLRADDMVVPTAETKDQFWRAGLAAIREGHVAVVTLAGGQGTRLGSSAPKGCYNIGLPSGMSLFEIQALRIRKLMSLAETDRLPWYIMTSESSHGDTEAFFRTHHFFGVPEESVRFFKQGELPAVGEDGKLILKTKGSLALSPNGNGGIYEALKRSGTLAQLRSQGIKYVHMYCVDNALVRVGDPFFLGACILRGTDCAAKSIEKTDPAESVGVFCRRGDGKLVVAEYSELDGSLAAQRDSHGTRLLFNQANIANHFFTVDFLERVAEECVLPMHLAYKKIPSIGPDGHSLSLPPMGYKMEAFIFDVFEHGKRPLVYQGQREEEFAPLKNAPGADRDTPEYCRSLLMQLHSTWLQAAGAPAAAPTEISPLLSYAGEGLEHLRGKKELPSFISS